MKKSFLLLNFFVLSISFSSAQAYKNSVQLESSVIISPIGYTRGYAQLFAQPGINYKRLFFDNFVICGSFSMWESFFIGGNEFYRNLNLPNDPSKVNDYIIFRNNFIYCDLLTGYKFNTFKKINQNTSFSFGISKCYGTVSRIIDYSNTSSESIIHYKDLKESFTGPVFQVEYNINPHKNRFNIGFHGKARYYKELKWEFDYGIHAGVNF